MNLLGRAVAIAAQAHQTQTDKAGAPYILHPLRIMMRGQTELEQLVGVLHDVVEDSDWTLDQLAAEGFPDEVIAALDALTRRPEESYDQFLDRVVQHAIAVKVKQYDLEDNMNLLRLATVTDADIQRLRRYHAAHQRLISLAP